MYANPTPGAVIGYRVFCAIHAFVFFSAAGMFAFAFWFGSEHEPDDVVMLVVLMVASLPAMIAYGAALFVPRRPWGWIVGMIAIIFGMIMVCSAPYAIPLLVFWLKPETQEWFGRLGATPADASMQVFD